MNKDNDNFENIKNSEDNRLFELTNTDSGIINSDGEKQFDTIDLEIEKDIIINCDTHKIPVLYSENNFENKLFRKIGNLNTFFYDSNGYPWIVIGPHWPFYVCLFMTITVIFLSFFYFVKDHINPAIKIIGVIVYSVQIGSYTYTFLKNPGIPYERMNYKNCEEPQSLNKDFKYCEGCHIIIKKNDDITHCDDCNVCIIGYDHHCPWTSKCIGRDNLKGFYVFITSTLLLFGYIIFAVSMLNTID
jgi:hypothetical protein